MEEFGWLIKQKIVSIDVHYGFMPSVLGPFQRCSMYGNFFWRTLLSFPVISVRLWWCLRRMLKQSTDGSKLVGDQDRFATWRDGIPSI